MVNWVLLAIAAMLLFSVSNVLLKLSTDKFDLGKTVSSLAPALAVGIVTFVISLIYLVNYRGVSLAPELASFLFGAIVLASLGVALFLWSLKDGKAASVTAVLSLSTIVVALISSQFLSVQFGAKEMAAMVLAVASIVLFVV